MSSATDYLLHLTSPTFIPGIIAGTFYGVGAIALLDKSKRNKFFLSYFYLGSGALLFALSEAFGIVWDRAQGERNYFSLHADLLLTTFGSVFSLLGLFRLLTTWQQVGMRHGRQLLSISVPIIICTAGLISTIGDIFMIQEDQAEHEEEGASEDMSVKMRTAILLQIAGASINLAIVIVYFILLCMISRKRRYGQTLLVVVLGILGLLVAIRWVYYSFILIKMIMENDAADDLPGWEAYMACRELPEILVISLAIFYDLTQVKNGSEELRPQGFAGLDEQKQALVP